MEFLVGLVASQEERGSTKVEVVAARVSVEERMRKTTVRPLYICRKQARGTARVSSP
jgi:hypothetical protein